MGNSEVVREMTETEFDVEAQTFKPSFKYIFYESDDNGTGFVDKAYLTVEEFKIKEGYKPGVWVHSENRFFKQTYNMSILVKEKAGHYWKKLEETDTIDFVCCPVLKIVLVSPYSDVV